ncbi:LysR family transcriptional regulator [Alkalibacterium olivapovliticus]|uniref:LysR family transcriptional activator of glutamate synthase operon n=1 Tax=Alkalibacterium olivapovliticus TaxID=99907 RepID=A0A2T0W5N2_9LACT|nr:LysR family transcriptional regulator [Alkalibacterium olivapovliticus]PRY81391.1 LysR family transcriptional activator of glutamate synthase operon [Alkalibacterium olivapovliticus]
MELKQLTYFIEVAEREHMSNAAQHLNVAQSAVSRQISNLEDELGVQLFERVGRNMKLLPIGHVLLTHARDMINLLDQTKQHIADFTAPETGIIKIGFPSSLAATLLPNLINAYSSDYPNVQFQLRQGSYQFLIDAIKSRELNLAFIGPVINDDPAIRGDILFSEKLLLLVSRQHKVANRESITLKELKDEDFILFPKGYILEKLVIDACHTEGFDPKVSTQGEDMDAIKGMVAAGIGITILPDSAITDYETDFLKCVPILDPHLERSVGMITPNTRELTPAETVFYRFVLDYFD